MLLRRARDAAGGEGIRAAPPLYTLGREPRRKCTGWCRHTFTAVRSRDVARASRRAGVLRRYLIHRRPRRDGEPRAGGAEAQSERRRAPPRARPHICRILPLINFIPNSRTYSVPRPLKRECGRTPGVPWVEFDDGSAIAETVAICELIEEYAAATRAGGRSLLGDGSSSHGPWSRLRTTLHISVVIR